MGTDAATIPVPRGAGMRRTITLPHLPVTCIWVKTEGDVKQGHRTFRKARTNRTCLAGNSVSFSNFIPPVAQADWNDGELGQSDGSTDRCGHLLRALHSKTHMATVVTHRHKGLEPRPLTGTGLLLHRHDLEDLILQSWPDEMVNDLGFLYRQREEIDVLQTLDFAILHQSTQLGHRDPLQREHKLLMPC